MSALRKTTRQIHYEKSAKVVLGWPLQLDIRHGRLVYMISVIGVDQTACDQRPVEDLEFMRQNIMAAIVVLLSTVFGLLLAEMFFHVALPPIPGDEGSVAFYIATAQRRPGSPRLFHAGYHAVFDIRGLYEGANKVDFLIGADRFIPPSPSGAARYKVLFLGGSVTEGIFLNASERWPARLNVPGKIDTYNASMSEAGMLAQYLTAKHLSERGDRFDLVVLATNHNDTGWSRRFKDLGSVYDFAHFDDGLKEVYKKDFELLKKEEPGWLSLRTVAWARHLLRVARLNRTSDSQRTEGAEAKGTHQSIVVDGLVLLQNGTNLLPRTQIAECTTESSPKTMTDLAYQDWQRNFPRFRKDMKSLLGAELLVISEPASFGAPSESFYQRDLRVFPVCETSAGKRAIEASDIIVFERERANLYLKAAKEAGAHTFDLASAMESVSNGPDGGRLFFDSIHPTPKGAEKFAELLKPVILETLN
jgi:hypothetical protein